MFFTFPVFLLFLCDEILDSQKISRPGKVLIFFTLFLCKFPLRSRDTYEKTEN